MSSQDQRPKLMNAASLGDALADCLRAAENGDYQKRAELLQHYDQWSSELRDFFTDWDRMERATSGLNGHRNRLASFPCGDESLQFGEYELMEEIGCGGMGIIFKAKQISLDRIVALKMIVNPRHDRDRFRLEAEAAARFQHPHIVSIYEIGEFEGRPYFSMQFIDGGNLNHRLEAGSVPPREAAAITATVARAVHFAHQHGILHRDLKPANILLDSAGAPYVSDFGLAKQVQIDQGITQTGAILGTPGYMAPEQAAGEIENLTVATDVHGLGAVLYATLVGEAPYSGQTMLETLRQITEQTPRAPRTYHADIPRDLNTICLKCLEKDPQARYSSAEALADDLDRFLRHEPIEARQVGQVERFVRWCRRNRAVASLAAVIAVMLIATTVISSVLASSFKHARDIARITLADSFTSKGITAGEHDQPGDAILWFAGAANLAKEDAQRVRDNLRQLDSYRQRVMEPVGALWLENTAVSNIQFDDDSSQLLCAAGSRSELWNIKNNQRLRLADFLPKITCSSLSPNGNLLAVGASDGIVVLVDIQSRQTLHRFEFGRHVRHLAFSQDGTKLAAAAGKRVHLWDCKQGTQVGGAIDHPRSVIRVAFETQGDRLLTVCKSATKGRGEIRLFRTGNMARLFDPVGCLVERNSQWRTAFWPTFIKDGRQLLVLHKRDREDALRQMGESDFHLYDCETGQFVQSLRIGGSTCLVVSPDTQTIVNCGDGHARVREFTSDGKLVGHRERLVHQQRIVAADFSVDGSLIATGGWDRDVRLWAVGEVDPVGVASNAPRPTLAHLTHQTRVTQVRFSPDNSLLATVQTDGLIRVSRIPHPINAKPALQISGSTRIKPLPPRAQSALLSKHEVATSSDNFADNESLFALTGTSHWRAQRGVLALHRWKDGKRIGPTIAVEGILMDSAFSSTGDQLATISAPRSRHQHMFRKDGTAGTLRLWTFPEGGPLYDPLPMPAEPRSVAYRPDGRQIAVMCARGQVLLIDTQNGNVTDRLKTRPRRLSDITRPRGHGRVRYSPDGQSLIAWSHGVWVWDVGTRQLRYPVIENGNHIVACVDVSADGKLLCVAGGRNLDVRVFDLQTGNRLGESIKHPDNVVAARFSPDGQLFVSSCRDGQARVYEWRTRSLVLPGMAHGLDVMNAMFTTDGKYLLTIGLDASFRAWRASDGRLAMLPHRLSFRDRELLLSPDSRSALVTGVTGAIHKMSLAPLYDEPRTSIEQAELLGELLSGQSIHSGGSVRLTTSDWLDRWHEYSR